MKSMTGYGNQKWQGKDIAIEVSLRCVNGRFFEPRFHLPREYVSLEPELKKILQKRIRRGTVDVFIFRKIRSGGGGTQVHFNQALAAKILREARALSKTLKIPLENPWALLIRSPEILRVEENSELSSSEKQALEGAFEKALVSCENERSREGRALKKMLLQILKQLESQVHTVASRRELANSQLQTRFESKVKSRLKGQELDSQRLAQEIVLQLERADINEELQRLGEHLTNFKDLIQKNEVEGKKLEFYTQELLREVNTIGSKSQLTEITQAVIEAKTLIERLREQVQNIE